MNDLLAYLATWPQNGRFRTWQIVQVEGGANNRLYRVSNSREDLAVKFTIRDERRRAWREHQALRSLREADLALAPQARLLDETSFAQPVVVQTWLDGETTAAPPQNDAEWEHLLTHYVAVHSVTPSMTSVEVAPAVINFNGMDSALEEIERQLTAVPLDHHPPALKKLWQALAKGSPSLAPIAPLSLCRVDPNTTNFICTPEKWFSVDWENSGWGDPVFEIAELFAHPKYLDVSEARRDWVFSRYAALIGRETAVLRLDIYYRLHLVWWLARAARMLYEVPRGLDNRLAPRPADWKKHVTALFNRYRELAETAVYQIIA